MASIRYEFIMSQIKHIRDIKENEKTKISLVFYEGCQKACVFKICKGRDLSEVYQALMEVRHPNLAMVYDCVFENGNTYVIEEYIPGKTLSEIIDEKGTFSEEETIRIICELCEGLEIMHQHVPAIIHNDIKTSNIILREDGSVKLFDFDISRIYKDGSYKNTRLMGTYEYAAPEHYGFGQSEPCTDIYSLGVTMHEMLTGVGLNYEHRVTYEGRLAGLIRKCVEIDRKKRYASAALLKADLEKSQKKASGLWKVVLAVLSAVLLLIIGAVFLGDMVKNRKEPQGNLGTEGEVLEGDLNTENEDSEDVFETESGAVSESEIESEEKNPEETENVSGDNETNDIPQENTPNTSQNGIEIIHPIQGTFLAMDAWKDGTFVHLEKVSGEYYLISSDGKEKKLENIREAYGAQLEYNPYTDQMYMLVVDYNVSYVYEVSKELEITFVKEHAISSTKSIFFAFYSDGTCIYDTVRYDLRDWSEVESIVSYISPFMIKDEIYSLETITNVHSPICRFLQMDKDGMVKNVYSLVDEGLIFAEFIEDRPIYNDSKCVYFIAAKTPHYYVYCFDGETFTPIKCLSDNNNYVHFSYEDLCVTENGIRCYSNAHHAIVEFTSK